LANGKVIPTVTPETLTALKTYSWPGNVRELQNYVERAIVLSTDERFTLDLLPPHVKGMAPVRIGRHRSGDIETLCSELVTKGLMESGDDAADLHSRIVSLVEREVIHQVLKTCQGVQTKAAARLGINRNTLHKKIEEYALQEEAR